jgi:nucleotide-binding universal stress UspA family protein
MLRMRMKTPVVDLPGGAMFRSIVVPLDGSTFSEHALPLAIGIARRSNAQLRLVHVHTVTAPLYAIDGAAVLDRIPDEQNRESELAYLYGVARRITPCLPVAPEVSLLSGPVAETLEHYVAETHTDLVVMTTHGRSAFSRVWLGSVADKLVRQTAGPVLLMRPGEGVVDLVEIDREQICEQVLIPLDGSTRAEQIIERAIALGSMMQAQYTLLMALDPALVGFAPPSHATLINDDGLEQAHTDTRAYLERIAVEMRSRSLQVTVAVVVGQPAVAILAYARDHQIDLIAMETHGRGGLPRFLLGSVTDKVVRGTHTPILLQRPRDLLKYRTIRERAHT